MSQSPIEKAIAAGAEWMEANKNHPDAQSFGCVAAAVADLARIADGDQKETADYAAVRYSRVDIDLLSTIQISTDLQELMKKRTARLAVEFGGQEILDESVTGILSAIPEHIAPFNMKDLFELILLNRCADESHRMLEYIRKA